MMKLKLILLVAGAFLGGLTVGNSYCQEEILGIEDKQWIGERIFENECSGKEECLVHWNEGEDFLSLGIGHFIWYPEHQPSIFDESFPKLLVYMKKRGVQLPEWLAVEIPPYCPWGSREEFLRDKWSDQVLDLRRFMAHTKEVQIDFIIRRMQDALPRMLEQVPPGGRERINQQFQRLLKSRSGVYALVDYVNFKGMGTFPTERYKGQGWGLLQVLGRMPEDLPAGQAVEEFVKAASAVLGERVSNAPPERNEQRWLNGWNNRIESYLDEVGD